MVFYSDVTLLSAKKINAERNFENLSLKSKQGVNSRAKVINDLFSTNSIKKSFNFAAAAA